LSTLWEYGVEAVAEPVSIQDMIVTPVLGSLVGEYLFSPWRAHIRAKAGPLSWSDKAVLVLTDPLGTINDQLDRWLGVKTSVQLQRIVGHPQRRQPAGARSTRCWPEDHNRLACAITDGVVAQGRPKSNYASGSSG
jgi:hypothetical protein